MAISASGAVSFSSLQTEFGGSNPISLNEYYSGGLPNNFSNTGSSTLFQPSVDSATSTYTYTSGKSTLTATIYYDGWAHSAFVSYFSGTTSSILINDRTGVDKTGNAGDIPSSGLISMNHFRGTSSGTNTPVTCYGIVYKRDTGNSYFPNTIVMYFGGHVGTAYTYGNTYSGSLGMPWTQIACAAKGNASATTFYNGTQTANGMSQGMMGLSHTTNATLGNVTVVVFNGYNSSSTQGSFSGTWNITVTH